MGVYVCHTVCSQFTSIPNLSIQELIKSSCPMHFHALVIPCIISFFAWTHHSSLLVLSLFSATAADGKHSVLCKMQEHLLLFCFLLYHFCCFTALFSSQIHLSHQSLVLTPGSTEHDRFGRRNIWTTKIWHKPEQQQGKVDRKQAQWPNSTVVKGCASSGAPCKTVLKLPVIYALGWYGNCNETLLGRSFHLNEWLNTF